MKTFYWGVHRDRGNGKLIYNFGDILTAEILKHYGIKYKHTTNHRKATHFGIGSIVRLARNSTVLGSGIIRANEKLDFRNKYRFVRGPLTRKRVLQCGGTCPEIYGDPALLLPRFYPPVAKKHKIGFVPHYSHGIDRIKELAVQNNWHFINLNNINPLIPAQEISSCEKIISTSLHGIIAAHAYDIPAAHVTVSDTCDLLGDGSKFKDYYASVGLEHKLNDVGNPDYLVGKLPDLDIIEGIFKEYV